MYVSHPSLSCLIHPFYPNTNLITLNRHLFFFEMSLSWLILSLSWFFWMSMAGVIYWNVGNSSVVTSIKGVRPLTPEEKLALSSHPGRWSLPTSSMKNFKTPNVYRSAPGNCTKVNYWVHLPCHLQNTFFSSCLPYNWQLASPRRHSHDAFWYIAWDGKCHFMYRLSTPYCLIFSSGLFWDTSLKSLPQWIRVSPFFTLLPAFIANWFHNLRQFELW